MTNSYHLAIDATNVQSGGGLTHLSQLLNSFTPERYGITKITIWTSKFASDKLPDRPWIYKKNNFWIEKNLLIRFFWQQLLFSSNIKNENCENTNIHSFRVAF